MKRIEPLHIMQKLEPIFTIFLLHKYGKKLKIPIFGYRIDYFANFF